MQPPGPRLLTYVILLAALAQLWAKPLPTVEPPGAEQPKAPGQKEAAALPTLEWDRPAAIRRVEYASNGHIEVAHALILVGKHFSPTDQVSLARQAVNGAFARRAHLHEVDVSVYSANSYDGFGGPPPLLTASVPRSRAGEFSRLGLNFERLWISDPQRVKRSPRPASLKPERKLIFEGDEESLRQQQRHQDADRSPLEEGLFFHGSPYRREAALTFDDSPHPLYEPLLLDTLRRARVKATFFCIGRNARAYPYFIKDMIGDGHELANHTYHHVRLPGLSGPLVSQEIELTNRVIEGLSGSPVKLFRPPGGEYSAQTLHLARRAGMTTVFWTDDPADFDNPGEGVIESRLLENLRPGGIILLHDNVLATLEVLSRFIRLAEREGYRLVPAGQLLEDS